MTTQVIDALNMPAAPSQPPAAAAIRASKILKKTTHMAMAEILPPMPSFSDRVAQPRGGYRRYCLGPAELLARRSLVAQRAAAAVCVKRCVHRAGVEGRRVRWSINRRVGVLLRRLQFG